MLASFWTLLVGIEGRPCCVLAATRTVFQGLLYAIKMVPKSNSLDTAQVICMFLHKVFKMQHWFLILGYAYNKLHKCVCWIPTMETQEMQQWWVWGVFKVCSSSWGSCDMVVLRQFSGWKIWDLPVIWKLFHFSYLNLLLWLGLKNVYKPNLHCRSFHPPLKPCYSSLNYVEWIRLTCIGFCFLLLFSFMKAMWNSVCSGGLYEHTF